MLRVAPAPATNQGWSIPSAERRPALRNLGGALGRRCRAGRRARAPESSRASASRPPSAPSASTATSNRATPADTRRRWPRWPRRRPTGRAVPADRTALVRAAHLHDIGRAGVFQRIWDKQGPSRRPSGSASACTPTTPNGSSPAWAPSVRCRHRGAGPRAPRRHRISPPAPLVRRAHRRPPAGRRRRLPGHDRGPLPPPRALGGGRAELRREAAAGRFDPRP